MTVSGDGSDWVMGATAGVRQADLDPGDAEMYFGLATPEDARMYVVVALALASLAMIDLSVHM
ncbi:hypothetical protein F5Y02DRAFT_415623 [Annulohypoxylon stygium]|nr:hypothetical protein F5Y02DRAFT_415623 [Annulohypoxylon stygium]